MKSVILSSILRGSRTNVGKVTRERSMPTLFVEEVEGLRLSVHMFEIGTSGEPSLVERLRM